MNAIADSVRILGFCYLTLTCAIPGCASPGDLEPHDAGCQSEACVPDRGDASHGIDMDQGEVTDAGHGFDQNEAEAADGDASCELACNGECVAGECRAVLYVQVSQAEPHGGFLEGYDLCIEDIRGVECSPTTGEVVTVSIPEPAQALVRIHQPNHWPSLYALDLTGHLLLDAIALPPIALEKILQSDWILPAQDPNAVGHIVMRAGAAWTDDRSVGTAGVTFHIDEPTLPPFYQYVGPESLRLASTAWTGVGGFFNVEPATYSVRAEHPLAECWPYHGLQLDPDDASGASARVEVRAGVVSFADFMCGCPDDPSSLECFNLGEVCGNGLDDEGDGLTDCDDDECRFAERCPGAP